jgi:four helix bundle protein
MSYYFEKLIVWQKTLELTQHIYTITKKFPKEEQFVLVDQMRRASVSIMSNIAESSGRSSTPDRNHFLTMSRGSSMELASQIILSYKLGYVSEDEKNICDELIQEIVNMLYSMIQKSL